MLELFKRQYYALHYVYPIEEEEIEDHSSNDIMSKLLKYLEKSMSSLGLQGCMHLCS